MTLPNSTPGGWLLAINSYGTLVNYTHESVLYPSNDTVTAQFPLSELLTSNTEDRCEDIVVLNGSAVVSDEAALVLPSFGSVTVF